MKEIYNPGIVKEQLKKEEIASQRIRDGIARDRAGPGLLFCTGVTKNMCRVLPGCADTMGQRRHAHEY
jgi:hypothetical protein